MAQRRERLRAVNDSQQLPPAALEAESAVLGAMMAAQHLDPAVAALIRWDSFYRPAHRIIWQAFTDLDQAGRPIDPIVVAGKLRDNGQLDDIGGPTFLFSLLEDTPMVGNAVHYAEQVANTAKQRRLIDLGARAIQAAHQGDTRAIDDLISAFTEANAPLQADDDSTRAVELNAFLAEPDPEYDFLIDGLLERGDRVILTGPEGGGKSTFMRQLAVQAGSGIHPFTGDNATPVRVLLVDLENSRGHIRRELRPLRLAAGDRYDAERIHIAPRPQGLDLLDTPDDVAWLERRIRETTPDLLLIGPLYKLAAGDPTEEQVARTVSTVLDRLRAAYGFALILEAHTPHASNGASKRPERPYGASMWLRWPEFGIHLSPQGIVSHWRGQRDERDWPGALNRGGAWPWTAPDNPREELWSRIAAWCDANNQTASINTLSKELGVGRGTVQRCLDYYRKPWEAFKRSFGEASE